MDELSPEQLEVLGACCELQLGRQLLAACAEGDQASTLALNPGRGPIIHPNSDPGPKHGLHPKPNPKQAAVEALWGDIYGADSDTYEHAQRLPGVQETPLAAAAAHGHTVLAAWLLERGVALDAVDSDGRTAFW